MANIPTGLYSHHVCGHVYNLKSKLSNSGLSNLSSYESTINGVMGEDYVVNENSIKNLPIVFHVVLDNPKLITSEFDLEYLLLFINSWFSSAYINFSLATNDIDNNILDVAGLNLIDASNNSDYKKYGVALGQYVDEDETIEVPGMLISEVQDLVSTSGFPGNKYINIILVNHINKNEGINNYNPLTATFSSSSNPYFSDISSNYNLSMPVIPLWAIGRSTHAATESLLENNLNYSASASETYFNYDYSFSAMYADLVNNGFLNIGMSARTRPIVHALGHMFGLSHPINHIGFSSASVCMDNLSSIYASNLINGKMYKSPNAILDTLAGPSSGVSHLNINDGAEVNSCDIENTINKSSLTHMHLNQFSLVLAGIEDEVLFEELDFLDNYYFSNDQIKWMHANFEYHVGDLEQSNMLSQIAGNYLNALGISIIDDIDDTSGEGNNNTDDPIDPVDPIDPCANSLNTNRSLNSLNRNLSEESLNFNTSLNNVENILNKFTDD